MQRGTSHKVLFQPVYRGPPEAELRCCFIMLDSIVPSHSVQRSTEVNSLGTSVTMVIKNWSVKSSKSHRDSGKNDWGAQVTFTCLPPLNKTLPRDYKHISVLLCTCSKRGLLHGLLVHDSIDILLLILIHIYFGEAKQGLFLAQMLACNSACPSNGDVLRSPLHFHKRGADFSRNNDTNREFSHLLNNSLGWGSCEVMRLLHGNTKKHFPISKRKGNLQRDFFLLRRPTAPLNL